MAPSSSQALRRMLGPQYPSPTTARFTSFTGKTRKISASSDVSESGAIRDPTDRAYKKSGDEPGAEQESSPSGPQMADHRARPDRAQRVHGGGRGRRFVRGPRAGMAAPDRRGGGRPAAARPGRFLPPPPRQPGIERALAQLVSQLA